MGGSYDVYGDLRPRERERLHFDYERYYLSGRQVPIHAEYRYDEARNQIHIDDPVWGRETIGDWEGDQLLIELFHHAAFRRLAGIEQLTLPQEYATMPNSFQFTRWEHAWGSVVFVRKMLREAEERGLRFDPRDKLLSQVQTGASDSNHRTFSHLIDWFTQGYGGPENHHDLGLLDYLQTSGVSDILRRHRIDPREVVFPDKADWIECAAPDLCVDRVDYIARETIRWLDPGSVGYWRDAFQIDEHGRLIMADEAHARYFGVCAGLLSTEHHGQPVHRLQLQLFGELVKSVALQGPGFTSDPDLHILDRLYTTDRDVLENVNTIGPLNNDLHMMMLDIGRRQRQIFIGAREAELHYYLAGLQPDTPLRAPADPYPEPLRAIGWRSEYRGFTPGNIAIKDNPRYGKTARLMPRKASLDVSLPALKVRSVDPLYYGTSGEVQRLSEHDRYYARVLADCRAIQRRAYLAKIYLAPHAMSALARDLVIVGNEWNNEMARPREPLEADTFRDILHTIGMFAIARSPHLIADERSFY